jgi:hypothetical protein
VYYYFQLLFQAISSNACSPNYYWYNKAFPLPRSLNLCTQSFIFEFFSSLFLHYIPIRSRAISMHVLSVFVLNDMSGLFATTMSVYILWFQSAIIPI